MEKQEPVFLGKGMRRKHSNNMHQTQTAEPRGNVGKNHEERNLKISPEVEEYRKEIAATVIQEV